MSARARLSHEVAVDGPRAVVEAIAALGRTEDVRFSPDGRRVALACFHRGAVAVVDVEVREDARALRVDHTAVAVLVAAELEEPHGVDWLDDRTLIVADRAGRVGLLDVPVATAGTASEVEVDLVAPDGSFDGLYGPGSVRVVDRGASWAEVLVCSNWGNRVTRTRLERGERWRIVGDGTELQHLLDLPDGVASASDGSWVAVSNHNRQVVVVYEGAGARSRDGAARAPVGVLRGSAYPHGLRFSGDAELLAVADAGSPFVHLHRRTAATWALAGYPTAALRVLGDDEFAAGNARPDEGGPKGVDLDPAELVLAVTCEVAPLRWFDWASATTAPPPSPAVLAPLETAALEREAALKDALADVEHRLMAAEVREHDARALASRMSERADDVERRADELSEWAAAEIAAAQLAAGEAHGRLAAIESTRGWRALAQLRRGRAWVRSAAGRGSRASPG